MLKRPAAQSTSLAIYTASSLALGESARTRTTRKQHQYPAPISAGCAAMGRVAEEIDFERPHVAAEWWWLAQIKFKVMKTPRRIAGMDELKRLVRPH
ncbi:hypothetical protein V1517DRAFT_322082 [Lipomyces orientalis]|uniref:Uncharacterized protein n=1 Tax=Lipomyces orientalis TaxID=1233043 RepID=A0ACC3TP18_9ASCO